MRNTKFPDPNQYLLIKTTRICNTLVSRMRSYGGGGLRNTASQRTVNLTGTVVIEVKTMVGKLRTFLTVLKKNFSGLGSSYLVWSTLLLIMD